MTSNIPRLLTLLTCIMAVSASAKTRETLTVTIDKSARTTTPKLELAVFSTDQSELSRITLPEYKDGESSVKYKMRVPEGSENVVLFVDGKKAYTFERSCATDDPMWGPMFRYGFLTDKKRQLSAMLQVYIEMAAKNVTYDLKTEVMNRLESDFKKAAADSCLYGQFSMTLPNPESWSHWFGFDRLSVLIGGIYKIGHEVEPRVAKLRFQ